MSVRDKLKSSPCLKRVTPSVATRAVALGLALGFVVRSLAVRHQRYELVSRGVEGMCYGLCSL